MDLSCVFFGEVVGVGKKGGGRQQRRGGGGWVHIPEMVKYDRKRGQKEKVKECEEKEREG